MPGELEEIILPTDSLDAKQFLPDSGQDLLDLSLRGLIAVA
jgi:hypothetical protein